MNMVQVDSGSNNYKLTIGGFAGGNAGNGLNGHNQRYFTTFDHDMDNSAGTNCAIDSHRCIEYTACRKKIDLAFEFAPTRARERFLAFTMVSGFRKRVRVEIWPFYQNGQILGLCPIQRVAIQRVAIQRVSIQRVPIQRVAIQRVAIQRVAIQRVAIQRSGDSARGDSARVTKIMWSFIGHSLIFGAETIYVANLSLLSNK